MKFVNSISNVQTSRLLRLLLPRKLNKHILSNSRDSRAFYNLLNTHKQQSIRTMVKTATISPSEEIVEETIAKRVRRRRKLTTDSSIPLKEHSTSNLDEKTPSNSNENPIQTKKERKPRMSKVEKNARNEAKLQEKNKQQNNIQCETKKIKKISIQHIKKDPLTPIELLLKVARNSTYTDAVSILENNDITENNRGKIQLITSCKDSSYATSNIDLNDQHQQNTPTNHVNNNITINIKPLLVLDINGILCHRIRLRKECITIQKNKNHDQFFRPYIAHIANTNIVPRINLHIFLQYLSKHFCLAVWTSAKAKNAKLLIDKLFPINISNKLLFIWAQHDCDYIINNENINEPIFVKDLQKVWNKYPLWNTNNTLLVDDSPDKCLSWQKNAVHPPPMNGLINLLNENDLPNNNSISQLTLPSTIMLDQQNSSNQQLFFENFINHWTENYLIQDWDSESGDAIITHNNNTTMFDFLKVHAVGHMGWVTNDISSEK